MENIHISINTQIQHIFPVTVFWTSHVWAS